MFANGPIGECFLRVINEDMTPQMLSFHRWPRTGWRTTWQFVGECGSKSAPWLICQSPSGDRPRVSPETDLHAARGDSRR
jgi:hypothetical protein